MLEKCILSMLEPKYNGFKVYVHNLADFDSVFLVRSLVKLGKVEPIMNNGRLVSMKFRSGKITLTFLDSYQLLLSSLRNLAFAFNCEVQKDIFPFNFLKDLEYIDPVPPKEYFPVEVRDLDYKRYASRFVDDIWNLREEAIKYCEADCISLHQVLTKFSGTIWDMYKKNITSYPTISSLTFAIFRTHFLEENSIPILNGQVFRDIKESYTGGATDMYIPTNVDATHDDAPPAYAAEDEALYCYDVNSLYPFVMMNTEMPVGKTYYFEGDISKLNPDALGFYYVRVTAPSNLEHPILQTHVNNMTMSPLGTWEMMIYSEEMKNAIKYGYKFEVLRGYYFESKKIVFKEYISELYNLRLDYDKSHPMNFIAKILMNSLYGRFGMSDSLGQTKIHDASKFNKMLAKASDTNINLIKEVTRVRDDHLLVTSNGDPTSTALGNLSKSKNNVNIAIASAITATARVNMSKYKNNPNFKLYYTDTDSLFTNLNPKEMEELIPNSVGKGIGQLKLEYQINRAVFLAPKAYYLELIDGSKVVKIKGLNSKAVNKAIFIGLLPSYYSLIPQDIYYPIFHFY